MEIKTYRAQIGFFVKQSLTTTKPDEISAQLRKIGGGKLDGDATILPGDLPQDFPILTLPSNDGVFQCEVRKHRFDIIYNTPIEKQTGDVSEAHADLKILSEEIFDYIKTIPNNSINRLAYITDFFINYPDKPEQYLSQLLLKAEMENINNFSLTYSQEHTANNSFTYNVQKTISIGDYNSAGTKEHGIIARVDINTSVEQNITFDDSLKGIFLGIAEKEFGQVENFYNKTGEYEK
jgi:hypothetical protein